MTAQSKGEGRGRRGEGDVERGMWREGLGNVKGKEKRRTRSRESEM